MATELYFPHAIFPENQADFVGLLMAYHPRISSPDFGALWTGWTPLTQGCLVLSPRWDNWHWCGLKGVVASLPSLAPEAYVRPVSPELPP